MPRAVETIGEGILVRVCALVPTEEGDGYPLQFSGGWSPIKNINNLHVKEIAEYAVAEYTMKEGKKLVLQRVLKGKTQVVAGKNYRLVLAVKDQSAKYQSVLYERIWEHIPEN